jgi:hypothetical protein
MRRRVCAVSLTFCDFDFLLVEVLMCAAKLAPASEKTTKHPRKRRSTFHIFLTTPRES